MTPNELSHADDPADAETLRLIHEELSNLPERLRLPLILCCVEGESREEAARQLGWSLGSLKGRLERGREMLHQRLTRRGVVLSMAALTGVLAGQGAVKVPAALAVSTVNSLVLVAAGKSILGGVVSANAAALTTGVLLSMKVAKLKIAALIAVAVLLTAGTSVVVVQTVKGMIAARQQPAAANVIGVLTPASELPQPAAGMVVGEPTQSAEDPDRERALLNLRGLALGMHQYHDEHGTFPPTAIRAADGTPLLSWRVALLPYMGFSEQYSQFKLDEPWDSPHNLALLEPVPAVYVCARVNGIEWGETFFQVVTGPGTVFPETGGAKISDIRDGTSNTLLIVESATPVPWTKPADVAYAPDQPLPRLGALLPDSFLAVEVDGTSCIVGLQSEQAVRALITANAGDGRQ
jgi:hypothetical protein